jgi:hypothetical protein
MKTTLTIPDPLLQQAEAAASLNGESLHHFITEAVKAHLQRRSAEEASPGEGWRSVFGQATPEQVEPVDAAISEAFEHIETSSWR